MSDVLLSIIIPVYNVEKYLEICLNSILNNNLKKVEIIIIDDGSTDSSSQICNYFAENRSNIIVIHQKNKGLSGARNSGLNVAKGDYIAFIDSDDFILPNVITDICNILNNSYSDFIFFNFYTCKGDDMDNLYSQKEELEVGKYILDNKTRCFMLNNIVALWSVWKIIVSKKFIEKYNLRFKENFIHEDIDWTLKLFLYGDSMYYSEFSWYCYRENRNGSITEKASTSHLIDVLAITKDLESLVRQKFYGTNVYIVTMQRLSSTCFYYFKDYIYLAEQEQKILEDAVQSNIDILAYSSKKWNKCFVFICKFANVHKAFFLYRIIFKLIKKG